MSTLKVFFYVQHLWGVGHVYRATRIARGMAKKGMDVHLIWGGTEVPGFDFSGIHLHRLPAVRTASVSFNELLHADGRPFDEQDKTARRDKLLELFDQTQPDILITEAFPFGRRQMLFELLPLLDHAKGSGRQPMIVASIRDIMQEGRKEKRVAESNRLVEDFYDLVLVHGDEQLIRIEETLQGAKGFLDKVRYTGLVTPEPIDDGFEAEFKADVLVSVGGGAFGQELTRVALEAMKHSKKFPANWLVSAGSEMSDEDFLMLQAQCPTGMRIVRQINNLASAMSKSKVSVSHAGYNTVADILRAGCASVLYPYTGGKETEQLRRAQIMSDRGVSRFLGPGDLTPIALAEAVDGAAKIKPQAVEVNLDGATRTAGILIDGYQKFIH